MGALTASLGLVGALTGTPRGAVEAPRPVAVEDTLARSIALTQQRLERVPRDSRAWAALALDYVARARTTGNPSWYAKAEGAAERSLGLDREHNDVGFAARSALASARHDFRTALAAARSGLDVNPYSAALLGAQADALTQLGRYAEATKAVARLNRLHPGVPAFTRASYALELRGDVTKARQALDRALSQATSPADVAFVRGCLAELELRYAGSATRALDHVDAGLAEVPADAVLLATRAKALVALGRDSDAVAAYQAVVGAAPQPSVALEQAELLQALHRTGAEQALSLFRALARLHQSQGQRLDVELVLYEADHGSPARAVAAARQAWEDRPFLETADAYAWALLRRGDARAALRWSDRALATGWPNALHLYHRGMIEKALGRDDAAREHLSEALRLQPTFSPLHAPLARQALDSLR